MNTIRNSIAARLNTSLLAVFNFFGPSQYIQIDMHATNAVAAL